MYIYTNQCVHAALIIRYCYQPGVTIPIEMSSLITGAEQATDALEEEEAAENYDDVTNIENIDSADEDGDTVERQKVEEEEENYHEEEKDEDQPIKETTIDEDVSGDTSHDLVTQSMMGDETLEGSTIEQKKRQVGPNNVERQKMFIICSIILFVVCINCFFNSLQCGFVFDDNKAVISNLDLRPSTPIWDLFKNDFWGTPLTSDRSHKSYRPLTVLTFRWNYFLGELEPGGYHFFNMIFHWILCVLILHVFKMFLSDWLAFILSMLFAVHPIHTDAVSGIVGRAESLSSIFALSALCTYSMAGGYRKRTDWHYIWITITLAVMATLCKEQGITIVAVCCAYEIFWSQKISLWEGLDLLKSAVTSPQHIPLWFVASVFRMLALLSSAVLLVVLRIIIMSAQLPHFVRYDNPIAFATAPTKQLSLSYLFPLNFWLLVYPYKLICDYSGSTIPLVTKVTDPRNLATLNFIGGLGALTYLALTGRNRLSRQIAMALAFLVFPFLPASNIFFPVGFVIAERILYSPSIGFSMLVVIGLQQILKYKKFNHLMYLLLGTTLFLHGARTARRNEDWISKESLFRAGLQVTTDNAKLWLNLGHFYENTGQKQEALACYNASFKSEYAIENGALTEIGRLHFSMGDDVMSEYYLSQAQKYMAPRGNGRYSPKYVQTFYHMAMIRAKNESQWPEAENMLKKAIRLNNEYEDAYKALSDLYLSMNEFHKATGILRRYLAIDPRNCKILSALGRLYAIGKNTNEALYYFEQCLSYSPSNENAQYNVALILEKGTGNEETEKLINRYKKLIDSSESNKAAYLIKLGEVYRKSGDYENALICYTKTLELLPDDKQALSALGVTHKARNDTLSARVYLQRVVELYPGDDKAWQRLGELYVDGLEALQDGLKCFQNCLRVNPENLQCEHNICVIMVRAKQYNDAVTCMERLSKKNPSESTLAVLEKLRTYVAKQEAKKAEIDSQVTLEIED
ncbi:protein O-mannosyl-transferase TMTC3-like isoform X2 [Apostichopus japonicus]|uniref:protein O-mannosyl-transferase TMTC3-like isoform X2 n=1 Tax=Stichopus japonicus TaxID=307972 RepID=UPI003AB20CED